MKVIVTVSSSLSPSSSVPVTVTVWAVSQLSGVKVRLAGWTVAALSSPLATATVTSPAGAVVMLTVTSPVPPSPTARTVCSPGVEVSVSATSS